MTDSLIFANILKYFHICLSHSYLEHIFLCKLYMDQCCTVAAITAHKISTLFSLSVPTQLPFHLLFQPRNEKENRNSVLTETDMQFGRPSSCPSPKFHQLLFFLSRATSIRFLYVATIFAKTFFKKCTKRQILDFHLN